MRAITALIVMSASAAWAGGPDDPKRSRDEDRTLTAADFEYYAAGYQPVVRTCYFEHARKSKTATGEIAVKLIVHRNGYVHDVSIDAPGVRGKHLRKLEACVRMEALGWHFPMRRDFTTAILPYYFLYLDIAGPQYSCWNPKGCPARKPTKPRSAPLPNS